MNPRALVETLRRDNLPHGRLPTFAECVTAVENPASADPRLLEYLRHRPEIEACVRQVKELTGTSS